MSSLTLSNDYRLIEDMKKWFGMGCIVFALWCVSMNKAFLEHWRITPWGRRGHPYFTLYCICCTKQQNHLLRIRRPQSLIHARELICLSFINTVASIQLSPHSLWYEYSVWRHKWGNSSTAHILLWIIGFRISQMPQTSDFMIMSNSYS